MTYADRAELAIGAAASALEHGLSSVLIVNNGCAERSTRLLRSQAERDPRIVCIELPENRGSASGFGTGLRAAIEMKADCLWLLDDDNVITRGDVKELLAVLERLDPLVPRAVAAMRVANTWHRDLSRGVPVRFAYAPPGSFLNFDVVTWALRAASRRGLPHSPNSEPQPIPWAPYGGLITTRESVLSVGFPDESLGLYEDDTEWTARIADTGNLRFSSRVLIGDNDGKWVGSTRGPDALMSGRDSRRRDMAVRNRIIFDRGRAAKNGVIWRYVMNRTVYLAVGSVVALLRNHLSEFVALRHAVVEGERAAAIGRDPS